MDETKTTVEVRNGFSIERPVIRASGSGRVREKDAARYLSCSERYLRKLRKEDAGPNYDIVAGKVWYRLSELDAWLDLCGHETER